MPEPRYRVVLSTARRVLLCRAEREVADAVVPSVSVQMHALRALGFAKTMGYKGIGHELMDKERTRYPVLAHRDSEVRVGCWSRHLDQRLRSAVSAPVEDGAYASEARHMVSTIRVDVSPALVHQLVCRELRHRSRDGLMLGSDAGDPCIGSLQFVK